MGGQPLTRARVGSIITQSNGEWQMAEPTLTDALNAIADMGRHFNSKLDASTERLERLEREVQSFREEVREKHIELRTELKVFSARLDEQRQTINAMIPTRIAAVPPAAE